MFHNPRATLWLFSYHGAEDETWLSIMAEKEAWGGNLVFRVKAGDAALDRARSKVASHFLEAPREEAGDVLLMVDSDNAWQAGDLATIAKLALERTAVVGGIYPKRYFNQGVVLRVAQETEGDIVMGTDTLIDAEFVGGGFTAIPRAVLETLASTLPMVKGDYWPFFLPFIKEDPPEFTSSDQAFCLRAGDAGFKVYGSTLPKVTHKGSYIFRMVDGVVSPPLDKDITIHLQREKVSV